MKVERESDLPLVMVAPKQVTQVFVNLILNALDAMPAGGTLTISSGRRGSSVYVTISDTGVGISPGVRDRLFEPFFTTKPPGKGTGLGLSISYATVQRYGGTITVRTEEGKGSSFTVSFPARKA